jgi:hypothetical protein
VSGYLHATATLRPGTDRRVGGRQSRSGRRREEKKFVTLSALELQPLDRPARSQSLYRLRYLGSLSKNV